jgi:hypothetical protein
VRFRIEQTSAASPQQLYDVMLDVERWPDWMGGVRRAGWQKRGAPGTGVGGVRRFGARASWKASRVSLSCASESGPSEPQRFSTSSGR